ncbi:MAG: helix-hairpin-helix domain-containing protein [Bryobacterales bacterium]
MTLRFWSTQLLLAAGLCAPRPAAAQNDAALRLDINQATVEDFDRLPGIGPGRAAALVRMRERNGPFRSVEELRALPRFPESAFQRVRMKVMVIPRPARRESQSQRAPR